MCEFPDFFPTGGGKPPPPLRQLTYLCGSHKIARAIQSPSISESREGSARLLRLQKMGARDGRLTGPSPTRRNSSRAVEQKRGPALEARRLARKHFLHHPPIGENAGQSQTIHHGEPAGSAKEQGPRRRKQHPEVLEAPRLAESRLRRKVSATFS